MAGPYHRLTNTRRGLRIATLFAMIMGLGIVAYPLIPGVLDVDSRPGTTMVLLMGGMAIFFLGAMVAGISELLVKIEGNSHRIHELFIDLTSAQAKQNELLETICGNSQLSDGVKSITHRDMERDALRKAIREDILKEDWEAAYSLIEDMENRFGYRLEAYNYRKEVDEFRATVIEDKVQTSLKHARLLLRERRWDNVQAETERLLRLAPKDRRVSEVITELASRKKEFKELLLTQWQDAVEKKDLDRAIELLKELDPYLTREEASQLEDSARSVFKAKLLDLGVQFRSAVTDKRWEDAIAVGEQIRTEFPNTKMAQEVTESADALRAKATSAAQQV